MGIAKMLSAKQKAKGKAAPAAGALRTRHTPALVTACQPEPVTP